MNFGKTLREIRKEKGFTQAKLALMINVSDSSIGDWEKERTQPNFDVLCELAKILNVTVGQLLGVEEY